MSILVKKILFKNKVFLYMHLDMIAVNFFKTNSIL